MADLITSAYAKGRIAQSTFASAEDTLIAELVTAVSHAVRRYCRREFDSQTFDQLYSGRGHRELLLKQFPIISVTRVASGLATVLTVTNTSASHKRATVAVTSTGLSLVRVASGVTTTSTLAFGTHVTLTALKTAIDALGNGWSAALPDPDLATWASADLRAVQGAMNAKDVNAELQIHVDEVSGYAMDEPSGILYRTPLGDHPDVPAQDSAVWSPGVNNYRVIYVAGFATVPEAVQEACAEWVAALYWQSKRDPALAQESIPGSFQRESSLVSSGGMPPHVRTLLAPYVKWS